MTKNIEGIYPMNLANYKDGRKDFCPLKEVTQEPIDYKAQYENYLQKSSIVIEQLRADRHWLLKNIEKIRAEISTVYESLDGYDPNSLGIFESRVTELIDNLLSEQGE